MLLIDLAIVAMLATYGYFGYRRGVILQIVELLQLLLSFGLAFAVNTPLTNALAPHIRAGKGLVALGIFLITWLLLELLLGVAWRLGRKRLPKLPENQATHLAGIAPALLKGGILIAILLGIVQTANLPQSFTDRILNARLAQPFLAADDAWKKQFESIFGQAFHDLLAAKTIRTGDDTSVPLGFAKAGAKPCANDEAKMIELVNRERTSRGLKPVRPDDDLRGVARAHSDDMLRRGYFAHSSPEGIDPFQRMASAGITYEYAGENLAFGPNVDTAMNGLMNSPGHRANILKPEYGKLGVGCLDAGIRGEMYSQEFTG